MTLKELLPLPPKEDTEFKKAQVAKMISADKARAAALLSATLKTIEASKPSISSVKKNVII